MKDNITIKTTQINTEDKSSIHLILDGNKTVDKSSFLSEISALLKFPDYFGHNWDALTDCLACSKDWTLEETYKDNIIVIWIDPLEFSKYNSDDFFTALEILKSINNDENNPLQFALASKVNNINIDLYR